MSDDNNQKSRGPRKGGGAGGRDGGNRGGGRPPARGGAGKAPFRPRSGEDRPRRASAEGGERRFEGERPAKSFGKSFGDRSFAGKSFGDKPSGPKRFEKKPFRERPGAERPARDEAGQAERPFRERSGDRPARAERPAFRRDAAPRPFRERSGDDSRASRPAREGERPRGERSFGDKPRGNRFGEKPAGRGFGGPRPGGKRFDAPRGERRHREEPEAETGKLLTSLVSQEPERIAKVMARAGVASRRDCEAIIGEGRVSVNGQIIDSPALDIGPNDKVLIDGEPLPERERTRLWLYHKPRGLVTTNHDPEGRATVFEYLPEDLPRVVSIGRLDINTEGLLLLTNDGGLARVLELPETGWLRRYRVRAFGHITQDKLDSVRDGVTIDGVSYGPVVATFEREQGANTWLTVDLREGKNREVKTVLEHLGLAVNRLIRISFGPFQLGEIEEGDAEEIRSRVLKDQLGPELMAKSGVDFESARRETRSEAPSAPKRAPAGEDRPRRRSRDEDETDAGSGKGARGGKDPLRGSKPWDRTVWRDEETEPKRERRAAPRRGADPKQERAEREASGDVKRVREAPIADPKGRRVKVERIRGPEPEPKPEFKPRRSMVTVKVPRAPRDEDETAGRDRAGESPWRQNGDLAERSVRGARTERDGESRGERRPPRRDAAEGGRPQGRGFGGKGTGDRGPGGKPGGRPFGGKPSGDRPGGRGPRPGGGRDRRG